MIWIKQLIASTVATSATAVSLGAILTPSSLADQRERSSRQPCNFVGGAVQNCSSSTPTVTMAFVHTGDTSACTFESVVNWGDGSVNLYKLGGKQSDNITTLGSHTYKSRGTYNLSQAVRVLSGNCTSSDGSYTFNHIV
jgi:uncharacterized membrane protein